LFAEALQLLAVDKRERPRYASMPPQPALISGRVMLTSWIVFTCVLAYSEPPEA
jgi:hypothetical protein